ncbi:MAG: VanZ family protein [Sulfuricella sp.]|nr:VanZ family protein [Sulfuricella sp.]
MIIAIVYFSLTPTPPEIDVTEGDKLGHLAAYGLAMLWFAQLYTERWPRRWLALGLVALGVALEYAQDATGYRTFDVADMLADAAGVALGWLAAPPRLPNLLALAKRRFSL